MVVLLLPLVAAILICDHIGPRYACLRHTPVNLLYRTEYAGLDSLCDYSFVLTADLRPTARCERYEAQLLSSSGRVILYLPHDTLLPLPQIGDTLLARTRIRRPDSIGTFDYATYLRRSGFIGTAYVRRYLLRPSETHLPNLQQRLYRRLAEAGLSGDEQAVVGALTLGCKEDLDPKLRRLFQASGAAHVLAVSGLHTGIFYGLLLGLLTLGGRFRPRHENRLGRWLISLLVIAVMWGYAWLTGLTPSVVRAVLMVTIVEVGRMAYRRSFSLNAIAAAAVFILLVHPLDLWSVSFQLSFAATAAIVLCTKQAERWLHHDDWPNTLPWRILDWTIGILIVSIAAQLGTLPITMYYFGQISNYFLLTNLIVLPLTTLLVPCGLLTIALGGTTFGIWLGHLTRGIAWTMNHAVGWLEALPGSTTQVGIGLPMVVVYYAIFSIFIVWMKYIRYNEALHVKRTMR